MRFMVKSPLVGVILSILLILSLSTFIAAAANNSGGQNVKEEPELPSRIYVVDAEISGESTSVLVIDPSNGEIVKTIETNSSLQIAISPDGSKLYVFSLQWVYGKQPDDENVKEDTLVVYDTNTFEILQKTSIHDRSLPIISTPMLTITPDGKYLFIPKLTKVGVSKHGFGQYKTWFSVLNAYNVEEEITQIEVEKLNPPRYEYPTKDQLIITGDISHILYIDLNTLTIQSQQSVPLETNLPVLQERDNNPFKIVGSALGQNGELINVRRNGLWVKLLDQRVEENLINIGNNRVIANAVTSAPSKDVLFVGVADAENAARGNIQQIHVYRTSDGKLINTIDNLNNPFHIYVSKNEELLFTVNPKEKGIVIYDIRDLRNITILNTIENVGNHPMWLIES